VGVCIILDDISSTIKYIEFKVTETESIKVVIVSIKIIVWLKGYGAFELK